MISINFAQSDPTLLRVPAGEILSKIKNGQPVEYDNVIVTGDLNLSNLDLSLIEETLHETKALRPSDKATFVNSSIRLNDSFIEGNVYMNNAIFEKVVNFNATKFNRSVYFQQSRFNGPSFFWASKFNGLTHFKDSKFIGSTHFRYSKFNGNVDFTHSEFNGSADFSFLRSNEFADFESAEFNGPADFSWSEFNRSNYLGSKFNAGALFWRSTFNSAAFFREVEFNEEANFLDSRFNKLADFREAKFNSIVNFESAKFKNSLSFRSTQFSNDAFFIGAQIKNLDLSLAKYEKLYLHWGSIGDLIYNANYGDTTYELLMANFRNLGFFSDFDNCYYQFRIERFLHRDFLSDPLGYLLDLGAWILYGFGKKPLYPLFWSMGIVLAFGVIWCGIGKRKREIITEEYSYSRDQFFVELTPFLFSATTFLSGTKLFVDPPAVPEMTGLPQSLIKVIFTLERALGAFFSILFFLAVGATIVR